MTSSSDLITKYLQSSNCAPNQQNYNDVINTMTSLGDVGSWISGSVQLINPQLSTFNGLVRSDRVQYGILAFAVGYNLVLVSCIIFAVGMSRRRKNVLGWNILYSLGICIVLVLTCSILMIIIVSTIHTNHFFLNFIKCTSYKIFKE